MQLSSEQQSIVEHQGQNLLVSAAAGSGKTRVLVERILHLLINHRCNLENMLVVTFTNAAAAEMKSRIGARLNDAIEETLRGRHNELALYLIKELNQLGQAQISTLHSFCTEIVRTHFYSIGVDPAFRVADSAESEILKREALEEIMDQFSLEEPDELLAVLDMFSSPFSDQGLQNLILRLDSYIMSRPDPWTWLEERIQALAIGAEDLPQSEWFTYLASQARLELAESLACFRRAAELCRGATELQTLKAFIIKEGVAVKEMLGETRPVHFNEQLKDFSFGRRPPISKKIDGNLGQAIADARDQGKSLVQSAQSRLIARDFVRQAEEYALMLPRLEFLHTLVQAYDRCYGSKKQERGLLDFNDLEHKALEALQDPDCAASYRQRFEHVFVDEYQDTSPIQEALLSSIGRGDNVFMVGDVKQGIYRFRLADPAIFLAKYHGYGSNGQGSSGRENGCLKLLDRNYRSTAGIIDAVNYLFGALMTEESGEIDYRQNVLKAGRREEANPQPVELLLLDNTAADGTTDEPPDGAAADRAEPGAASGEAGGLHDSAEDSRSEDGNGALLEDMQQAEKEAWAAAQRIRQLTSEEELIEDSGTGLMRPARYRDICILMRATARTAEVFSQVFERAGIPLYTETAGGYFDSLEIQLVLNLLRLIDNKRQDLALLSVMHAPFFGFSLSELAEIRVLARDRQLADSSYCAAVEYCAGNGPPPLADKAGQMLQRLADWKEEARFLNLDQLIWKLLMETGFYYYAAAMPGGRQRTANLDLLLEKARSYEASSLKGLFNFISFVDRLRAGGQDTGAAPLIGENDNVVRIMSIHKSKGLEFPVVLVAGLGRQFNTRDSTERLLLHGEMGLGPYFIDTDKRVFMDTLARQAISGKLRLESQAEEMRILYVAMTRAESRLILCGSLGSLERSMQKWRQPQSLTSLRQARSYLDWMGPVILRHQEAGAGLRASYAVDLPPGEIQADGSRWKIIIQSPRDVMAKALQPAETSPGLARAEGMPLVEMPLPFGGEGGPDLDSRLEQILQGLEWQYPYGEAGWIPSKMSVTSVKRFRNLQQVEQEALREMAQPVVFNRPRLAAEQDTAAWTGAEMGTINHLVLQQLDLERVGSREQIDRQLEEMTGREVLSPAEAAAVDPEMIWSFYRSDLGQRLLQASIARREVPFNLKISAGELLGQEPGQDEEMLLQGVIDLFFEEDGEVVLVDYKSDHPGRQPEEILESYGLQVNLYRRALERIQQRRVKAAYIYMLASGQSIEVPVY